MTGEVRRGAGSRPQGSPVFILGFSGSSYLGFWMYKYIKSYKVLPIEDEVDVDEFPDVLCRPVKISSA